MWSHPPAGAYVAVARVTSHHEAEVRGKFPVDTAMMMQAVDPEGVGSRQHTNEHVEVCPTALNQSRTIELVE